MNKSGFLCLFEVGCGSYTCCSVSETGSDDEEGGKKKSGEDLS